FCSRCSRSTSTAGRRMVRRDRRRSSRIFTGASRVLKPPEDLVASLGGGRDNEPVDQFRRSSSVRAGYVFGLITLATVGIGFLVLGAVFVPRVKAGPPRTIGYAGCVFLSAFTLGMGWFHWAAHYRITADHVLLYDEGLIWHTMSGGWGVGRWANLVSLFRS